MHRAGPSRLRRSSRSGRTNRQLRSRPLPASSACRVSLAGTSLLNGAAAAMAAAEPVEDRREVGGGTAATVSTWYWKTASWPPPQSEAGATMMMVVMVAGQPNQALDRYYRSTRPASPMERQQKHPEREALSIAAFAASPVTLPVETIRMAPCPGRDTFPLHPSPR